MKLNNRSRSGVILLIVLAVLGLMSVLALTFVQMARLEKSIARNYVDHTRAVLAAENGIEFAVARLYGFHGGAPTADELSDMEYRPGPQPGLENAAKASFQALEYPSFPVSGLVSGTPGGYCEYYILKVEDESGKLNLNDTNGRWNLDSDPLPDVENDASDPDEVAVPERLRKITESLGDVVIGEGRGAVIAGALFDTDPAMYRSRPNLPNGRFASMQQVKDALMLDYPGVLPALDTEDEWERFSACVTLWSWQDPDVIRPTFKLSITTPAHSALTDFGNVDRDRLLQADPALDTADKFFNVYLYSDMQTRRYETEPRCPVNINTVSLDLLQALIAPVRGWYLYEGRPSNLMNAAPNGPWMKAMRATSNSWQDIERDNGGSPLPMLYAWNAPEPAGKFNGGFLGNRTRYGKARLTRPFEDGDPGNALDLAPGLGITYAEAVAKALHDRIHVDDPDTAAADDPRSFRTWDEFTRFLYALVDPRTAVCPELTADQEAHRVPYRIDGDCAYPGQEDDPGRVIPGFDRYMADALLANFNPNSSLNDFNPDAHLYKHVDKAQLTQYSTELCFQPTGYFTVDSQGRVAQADGAAAATYQVRSSMRLFYLLRQTTQKQFMTGDSEDDANGYNPYDPETLYEVFAENGATLPTAGADLEQDSGYRIGRFGPSLTSYPEPLRIPGGCSMEGRPVPGKPGEQYKSPYLSAYDGSLMLSTWQPDARFFEDPAALGKSPMLMATMGYRHIGDVTSAGVRAAWAARTQAVGGLLPVRMAAGPDTMDVDDGRGALLAWADDYTVSSLYPNPSWYPVDPNDHTVVTWSPIPSTWKYNAPWNDVASWKTVYNDYGDHTPWEWTFWSGLHLKLVMMGPDLEYEIDTSETPPKVTVTGGEKISKLNWNTPSDMVLTPDIKEGQTPGVLYADGAFSEAGRLLAFPAHNLGSEYGTEGSLSFWVKPNWDTGYSNRMREFFTMGHYGWMSTHALDLLYFPAQGRPSDDEASTSMSIIDPGTTWPVPTHSFMFGWFCNTECEKNRLTPLGNMTWDYNGMIVSPTATDFFPDRNASSRGNHDAFGFYGHQWNHVAMSYRNHAVDPALDIVDYAINGLRVPGASTAQHFESWDPGITDHYWEDSAPAHCLTNPQWNYPDCVPVFEPAFNHIGARYLRFGWCEDNAGPTGDSTYDDIVTFADPTDALSLAAVGWGLGRYCNMPLPTPSGGSEHNDTAVGLYTSPAIDVSRQLSAGPIDNSVRFKLHSVAWTLYWPRYNWRPGISSDADWRTWGTSSAFDGEFGVDLHDGMAESPASDAVTGDVDPLTIDILGADGTWHFSEDEQSDADHEKAYDGMRTMLSEGGGSQAPRDADLEYRRQDAFRYRVYFHLNPNRAMMESPVFDDITFTFVANRPQVLYWEVVGGGSASGS